MTNNYLYDKVYPNENASYENGKYVTEFRMFGTGKLYRR